MTTSYTRVRHLSYGNKREAQRLTGRRIVRVCAMSNAEIRKLGWEKATVVIELDNGTILIPKADDKGSGPGAILGVDTEGQRFNLFTEEV